MDSRDDIMDDATVGWVPDGWYLDVVPEPQELRQGKGRLRARLIRAGRGFVEALGELTPPW